MTPVDYDDRSPPFRDASPAQPTLEQLEQLRAVSYGQTVVAGPVAGGPADVVFLAKRSSLDIAPTVVRIDWPSAKTAFAMWLMQEAQSEALDAGALARGITPPGPKQ
jgi:hypothetical protein